LIFRKIPEFSCIILILTNLITFYKIALNTKTHGLHIDFQMAFMASFIIIKILLQHLDLYCFCQHVSSLATLLKASQPKVIDFSLPFSQSARPDTTN